MHGTEGLWLVKDGVGVYGMILEGPSYELYWSMLLFVLAEIVAQGVVLVSLVGWEVGLRWGLCDSLGFPWLFEGSGVK